MLAPCARLGMGRLGVVALDGMKIAANASKPANRTDDKLRELAARTDARHGETGAAEDALSGAGARGDEVPGACWSPRSCAPQRIAAALASLEAEHAAAAAGREALARACVEPARAGTPRAGRHPAEAAAELALLNLEKVTAAGMSEIAAAAEAARAAAAIARVNVEINLAGITDEQASLEMIAETGKAENIIARAEQISHAGREQIRA